MRSTLIIIAWNEPFPDNFNFPRGHHGFPIGKARAAQADARHFWALVDDVYQPAMLVAYPCVVALLTPRSRRRDHQVPVAR